MPWTCPKCGQVWTISNAEFVKVDMDTLALEALASGNGEWEAMLALVKSGYPPEKARELALVWVFGTEYQYHTDPIFHSKIKVMSLLLLQVDEAAKVVAE